MDANQFKRTSNYKGTEEASKQVPAILQSPKPKKKSIEEIVESVPFVIASSNPCIFLKKESTMYYTMGMYKHKTPELVLITPHSFGADIMVMLTNSYFRNEIGPWSNSDHLTIELKDDFGNVIDSLRVELYSPTAEEKRAMYLGLMDVMMNFKRKDEIYENGFLFARTGSNDKDMPVSRQEPGNDKNLTQFLILPNYN